MRKLFYLLAIGSLLACNNNSQPKEEKANNERSDKTKLMIANMKLARDPHTFRNPMKRVLPI
jgi:hypothetical protein